MSLAKAKDLQDLKAEAKEINDEKNSRFMVHRAKALTTFLDQMKAHLLSQGFSAADHIGPNRGFTARYKGLELKATASKDDEHFIGADYSVDLESGKKKAQVMLSVGRNEGVKAPVQGDLDKQLQDYKERYLPEIKALINESFNDNHKIYFSIPNTKVHRVVIANGVEAIDLFSSHLL